MSGKFKYYFMNLLIVFAGVVLIAFNKQIRLMEYIVIMIGVLFAIPSFINLISVFIAHSKSHGSSPDIAYSISSIGALAVGVFMIVKPIVFVGIASYLLASLLVIGGLYQLILLISGAKRLRFPGWLYISPVLILVAGIVILASSVREIQSAVVLITGIGFILFAFNNVIEGTRREVIVKITD